MRILFAALLSLALSTVATFAHGSDCESLFAQLDDVLEDIDIGLDNIRTATDIVNAPDFDPAGPNGWVLTTLPGLVADVAQDVAFSNQLSEQLHGEHCY